MKWFDFSYSEKRVFGLDIMRAYAILSVLYLHAYTILRGHFGIDKSFLKWYIVDGVSVFFVLSGFLIGGIIIDLATSEALNSLKDIIHFWQRRWLRTIPAYFFVLILNLFFCYAAEGKLPENTLSYFVFLQTFYHKVKHYFFFESWSLCVEEWFYFSIPLLFVLFHYISKSIKVSIALSIAVLMIYATFFRYYFYMNHFASFDAINFYRFATVNRLDSIAYGILGVMVFKYYPSFWAKIKYPALVIGIVLLIYNKFFGEQYNTFDFYNTVLIFTVEPLIALCFLPFLNDIKEIRYRIITQVVTRISIISYALYLLNAYTVKESLINILFKTFPFDISADTKVLLELYLFLILSFLLAHLLYAFVEKPFMAMRK